VDAVVNAPKGHPSKAKLDRLTGTFAACSASDGINHAVLCISRRTKSANVSLRSRFGNGAAERVADEGTQTLIAGEEEQFVFLDRPAHDAAELFQFRWQLVAHSREVWVGYAGSIGQPGG